MMKSYRNFAIFTAALTLTVLVVMLAACQTTAGGQSTISVSQMIADAAALNNGLVTTTTSLLNAGAISSADAASVLKITDEVNAAITAANALYASGSAATAQGKITVVIDLLASAASCVNAAKAMSSPLTSCIAPVLATAGSL
jgi:hypothetical protein